MWETCEITPGLSTLVDDENGSWWFRAVQLTVLTERSRVQRKGVTQKAGLIPLKQDALTGLNSSLSDPFGITASAEWDTSLPGLIEVPLPLI